MIDSITPPLWKKSVIVIKMFIHWSDTKLDVKLTLFTEQTIYDSWCLCLTVMLQSIKIIRHILEIIDVKP